MSSGPILALDTSGSFCSVAVMGLDGRITSRASKGEGDHFERLPQLVRSVCYDAGIEARELGAIRVGLGPGSFTGLRIGMSFAKGIATALRIPLTGTCSFRAAAISVSKKQGVPGPIFIVADARRGELFFGSFEVDAAGCRPIQAPAIISAEEAREVVGGKEATMYTPERGLLFDGNEVPTVSSIGEGLVLDGGANGPFSLEQIAELEPSYIRGVSAKSIAERRGT